MKLRRFLAISALLTLILLVVLIVSFLIDKDVAILMMFNYYLFLECTGSWVLTLLSAVMLLFKKASLPGRKSYRICNIVLFVLAAAFGIVSLFIEKSFSGSSAQLILIYLLPMILLTYIALRGIDYVHSKRKAE